MSISILRPKSVLLACLIELACCSKNSFEHCFLLLLINTMLVWVMSSFETTVFCRSTFSQTNGDCFIMTLSLSSSSVVFLPLAFLKRPFLYHFFYFLLHAQCLYILSQIWCELLPFICPMVMKPSVFPKMYGCYLQPSFVLFAAALFHIRLLVF